MNCYCQQCRNRMDFGGQPEWSQPPMESGSSGWNRMWEQPMPAWQNQQNNRNGSGQQWMEGDFSDFPLAMSYVPIQRWSRPLPMERGFNRGTIFAELDLPFMMGRCQ